MQIPNINKRRIIELLREGKRLDGRKVFDYRDIIIETDVSNKAEGSARVRIGKTDVIVGVKLENQEPYSDHDDWGTMMVSMEFSPAAGERYESGPPKINAIETARVVDRGIRESGFIDWKKLCIKKGEKVWSILIDIYCINDDGNTLDACFIGSVAALKMAKFPVYDKKEEKIEFGKLSKDYLPLTENVPFTMTFYKAGESIILDPNREEEDTAEARLTLSISQPKKDKIINSMQKGGIIAITADELDKIIEESEKIYDKLSPIIEKKIGELVKEK
mgnify:FL=1